MPSNSRSAPPSVPQLPTAIETSRALIGALLLEPSNLSAVHLPTRELYMESHRWILDAMRRLEQSGLAIDLQTVAAELERDGRLDKAGENGITGMPYLINLTAQDLWSSNFRSYERIIRDAYTRRTIQALSEQMAGIAHNGHGPAEEERLLSEAEHCLAEVRAAKSGTAAKQRGMSATALLRADLPPLRWLVKDLIIRPGLTVLGGSPKVGKSWLALQAAMAVSKGTALLEKPTEAPGRVAYYALEDGPARLQNRLFKACWDETDNVTFFFGDDLPPLDDGGMATLESDIQAQQPAMVILDSLAAAKSANVDENDAGQMAELMYKLSRLKDRYDLSLVVVHHHRKMTTGSPLADLRGSGALGGAADAILALYRERGAPECKLALDSRDAEGDSWTLGFTNFSWTWLGDGELAGQRQAERKITKALMSIGKDGATLDDIISTTEGIRRQDALNALKALVEHGTARHEDLPHPASGRPRRVWRFTGVI